MALFAGLDTQVLGISVDHVPCLQAWAESLGNIDYPLLSDFWPHGQVAQAYGVLRPDGRSERAIFLIDKNGIIRYIDVHDIDQQPDNEELRKEIRRIDPVAAAKEMAAGNPHPFELPHGGIILYCTRWCPDCRRARAWFESNNLEFTEIDVNAVPEAASQVREWADGKLITPTFDIDGTIIVNYDLDKLSDVLKDRIIS
jgi:glutaredoxin